MTDKKKTTNKKNDRIINLILIGVMVLGVLIVAYPTISDWWNSYHQTRAIASYTEQVAAMDTGEAERMLKEAEAYNAELVEKEHRFSPTEEDLAYYNSILDVTGTGIMGYVEIPKLHISLPIYHGTDDAALQVAIGHLSGTSLPVGGESSHCVVSGHRGLPSAKLFTDLDKMLEGDIFTLTVLDRTLTYQVDQIRIVEPSDLSELAIIPGKDLCTLVTCTPYGINTHRLLVRGHRVANLQGDIKVVADALQIEAIYIAPFIGIPLLVMLLFLMLYYTGERQRHNKALKNAKEEFVNVEAEEKSDK